MTRHTWDDEMDMLFAEHFQESPDRQALFEARLSSRRRLADRSSVVRSASAAASATNEPLTDEATVGQFHVKGSGNMSPKG